MRFLIVFKNKAAERNLDILLTESKKHFLAELEINIPVIFVFDISTDREIDVIFSQIRKVNAWLRIF